MKRNFISTGNVENFDFHVAASFCGEFGDEALTCFVNDIRMPASLNEGNFEGCLVRIALVHRFLTKLESGRTKEREPRRIERNQTFFRSLPSGL
ncbi:hypothetical protein D9M69_654910 [compost metagenome]